VAVPTSTGSASLCVSRELRGVTPPFPVLVLAERWPSALISVLALDLPIVAAYFPVRFHWYFKPRNKFMTWHATSLFTAALVPAGVGLLLSGSLGFLERTLVDLALGQRVIVSVDTPQ